MFTSRYLGLEPLFWGLELEPEWPMMDGFILKMIQYPCTLCFCCLVHTVCRVHQFRESTCWSIYCRSYRPQPGPSITYGLHISMMDVSIFSRGESVAEDTVVKVGINVRLRRRESLKEDFLQRGFLWLTSLEHLWVSGSRIGRTPLKVHIQVLYIFLDDTRPDTYSFRLTM